MQGIFYDPENWDNQYACFLCPHCNGVHCLYLSKSGAKTVQGLHIWGYKWLDDTTIQIEPSYDNSKFCGWHGPFTWQIEIISEESWVDLIHGK